MRQSKLENYVSEIDVIPNEEEASAAFTAALKRKLKDLSGVYPNLGFRKDSGSIRVQSRMNCVSAADPGSAN